VVSRTLAVVLDSADADALRLWLASGGDNTELGVPVPPPPSSVDIAEEQVAEYEAMGYVRHEEPPPAPDPFRRIRTASALRAVGCRPGAGLCASPAMTS
jgi:hypothetical protein